MSFAKVKARTTERFSEVQFNVAYITSTEPRDLLTPSSLETKIMKGLFFVHLYAALEKSITDTTETTLLLLASRNIKTRHFDPPILSIVLNDKINSLKDGKHAKILEKSVSIFKETNSHSIVKFNETILSSSLQNIWAKTIEELTTILGIGSIGLTIDENVSINEITDKRNAIAHGRDSASTVGERYTSESLRIKANTIYTATTKIINTIEAHYEANRFIKPSARRFYV